MRFFTHYTPYDQDFDPYALVARYGTDLRDKDGHLIATVPHVPDYVLPAGIVRYTTNPLHFATLGVQSCLPENERGNLPKEKECRQKLMHALLERMNIDFQHFLPEDKRNPDLELKLDYMTVFLTSDPADDTRKAFPAADFLRMRVVNKKTHEEVASTYGANASYIFRDTDFYQELPVLLKNTMGPAIAKNLENFGKRNAQMYKAMFKQHSPAGILDTFPISCIAVSDKYPLEKSGYTHSLLGTLYENNDATQPESITDLYFKKMGIEGSNFMPFGECAPYRFMHHGDLEKRSDYELAAVTSVMTVFQKLIQQEIYCADTKAGDRFHADRKTPYTPLAGLPLYDLQARNHYLGPWQGEMGRKWVEANPEILHDMEMLSETHKRPLSNGITFSQSKEQTSVPEYHGVLAPSQKVPSFFGTL